ncbi:F-box/kelch-repeat protein At3g23880-like [Rhododendron vialii]|uniref:F-box/kelch-repeat protein At3g23880-like n=1 Tax=Rhododendron vialii TaxID=182163 RepID=UPI00266005A1|nr:F-box/kelch-repeat protein At3g23880-like [Rhododendron vialii]
MATERNPIRHKTHWAEDSKQLPNLPNEINVEILLRLPVKSLLRFRCACKSWCSSISDPKFVKTHLSLASSNPSYTHQRLLITNDPLCDIKSCSISSIMRHEQSVTAVGVDYPFVPKRFWIEATCDGLVCVHTDKKTIFLWNPSTKKSRKLPSITIPYDWSPACGLGYDTSTDDYKVVLVFNGGSNRDYHRNKVAVYALRADSWRRIADCPHSIPMAGKGKFVSGALHWTVSGSSSVELIVSLDLAKETYGEVLQPDYNSDGVFLSTMDVLSGYLCMLCRQWRNHGVHVDLWVMKEYGIRESWTKLVAVHDVTHPLYYLYGENFTPKCILNNGDVLMVVRMCLVRYNPNNGKFSYPKICGVFPNYSVYPYIESLVSP